MSSKVLNSNNDINDINDNLISKTENNNHIDDKRQINGKKDDNYNHYRKIEEDNTQKVKRSKNDGDKDNSQYLKFNLKHIDYNVINNILDESLRTNISDSKTCIYSFINTFKLAILRKINLNEFIYEYIDNTKLSKNKCFLHIGIVFILISFIIIIIKYVIFH